MTKKKSGKVGHHRLQHKTLGGGGGLHGEKKERAVVMVVLHPETPADAYETISHRVEVGKSQMVIINARE